MLKIMNKLVKQPAPQLPYWKQCRLIFVLFFYVGTT